jgi:hypothetical protein
LGVERYGDARLAGTFWSCPDGRSHRPRHRQNPQFPAFRTIAKESLRASRDRVARLEVEHQLNATRSREAESGQRLFAALDFSLEAPRAFGKSRRQTDLTIAILLRVAASLAFVICLSRKCHGDRGELLVIVNSACAKERSWLTTFHRN